MKQIKSLKFYEIRLFLKEAIISALDESVVRVLVKLMVGFYGISIFTAYLLSDQFLYK